MGGNQNPPTLELRELRERREPKPNLRHGNLRRRVEIPKPAQPHHDGCGGVEIPKTNPNPRERQNPPKSNQGKTAFSSPEAHLVAAVLAGGKSKTRPNIFKGGKIRTRFFLTGCYGCDILIYSDTEAFWGQPPYPNSRPP
jgi:hypothetical protein